MGTPRRNRWPRRSSTTDLRKASMARDWRDSHHFAVLRTRYRFLDFLFMDILQCLHEGADGLEVAYDIGGNEAGRTVVGIPDVMGDFRCAPVVLMRTLSPCLTASTTGRSSNQATISPYSISVKSLRYSSEMPFLPPFMFLLISIPPRTGGRRCFSPTITSFCDKLRRVTLSSHAEAFSGRRATAARRRPLRPPRVRRTAGDSRA